MALPRKNIADAQAKPAAPKADTSAAPTTTEKVRETVTATQDVPEGWGKDSADIAVVANLGDPSKEDSVSTKGPDGKVIRRPISTTVGYRIKNVSDKDIQIPDFGIPKSLKKNLMDFEDHTGTAVLKPGETADLTRAETAALGAQVRFGNEFTGGEWPCKLVFQSPARKNKAGEVVLTQGVAQGASLARIGGGSIKDLPMIDVLDVEKIPSADGKRNQRKRTPKAEFPKFVSLSQVQRRASGASRATRKDDNAEQYAKSQAFLASLDAAAAQKAKAAK